MYNKGIEKIDLSSGEKMAVARGKIAISGIDDGEKRARDGVL